MRIDEGAATSRPLQTLLTAGAVQGLTDGQLLERFCTHRDALAESAFAALVDRHGPMMLRTCQSVLDSEHDAEDAFQATFLVLAHKARRLWVEGSLAPWLHQVACRTAHYARSAASRRRRLESRSASVANLADPALDAESREQSRLVHVALADLADRDRAVLVLCDLQGRTHDQAAQELGWPVGTVKSRLTRARDRLRSRLARLGRAEPFIPLTNIPRSMPSSSLSASTVALAARYSTFQTLPCEFAASLTREVLRAMIVTRLLGFATTGVFATVAVGFITLAAAAPQDAGPVEGNPETPTVESEAAADDPRIAVAKHGEIRGDAIAAIGVVETSESIQVAVPDGIGHPLVLTFIAPEGARVRAGDEVARLESPAAREKLLAQTQAVEVAEAAVAKSSLRLETARLAFVEFTEGTAVLEETRLQSEVTEGEASLLEVTARVERSRIAQRQGEQVLAATPAPTTSDIRSQLELDDRLEDAVRLQRRTEVTLELNKSRLDVFHRFTKDRLRKGMEEASFDAGQNDARSRQALAVAKGVEDAARKEAAPIVLTAPIDGLVVHAAPRRGPGDAETGEQVRQPRVLAHIINDQAPRQVRLKVREPHVHQVVPGERVRLFVNGAEAPLDGKVKSVAPSPDPVAPLDNERKLYTTLVEFNAPPEGLQLGSPVKAEIVTTDEGGASKTEAGVVVPVDALVRFGRQWKVAVKSSDGPFLWREVALGLDNGTQVVVQSGITPGDVVSLRPKALLQAQERTEHNQSGRDSD